MSIPQIFHKRQLPPRPVRNRWWDKGSALEGGETSLKLGKADCVPITKKMHPEIPGSLQQGGLDPVAPEQGKVGVAGAVFTAGFRGDGFSSSMRV